MPRFDVRADDPEMMDDLTITDHRLTTALDNLRLVNRWLGGYGVMRSVLKPLLQKKTTVLDLGTGVGDFPEEAVRWADRLGFTLHATGIDLNPATVAYAQDVLRARLPDALHARIHIAEGDALSLPYADDTFDVVMAALFMHHLRDAEAVHLLREMHRVARRTVLVNDLHRHPLAYYSIKALALVLPVSPMFVHDAPLSVLRGFTRWELLDLSRRAGLGDVQVRWHWAFRWSLVCHKEASA